MTENKDHILNEVQDKLDQLISSYEMCLEANSMLSSEIEEIKSRLDKRNAEYEALQKRFETLKVARSLGETPEGKKEAKAKINAIMREVDQCIALLNR
jgi:septation ring formation regulator EzrA